MQPPILPIPGTKRILFAYPFTPPCHPRPLSHCLALQNTHGPSTSTRLSAGLDDAAAVELLSATDGEASAMAAQGAKKTAREREGKKINAALQKLEKVRTISSPKASK